jgi:hypothetical protein
MFPPETINLKIQGGGNVVMLAIKLKYKCDNKQYKQNKNADVNGPDR